jgi:hypothetical protein
MIRILASVYLSLALGTCAFAQCHAPRYRVGRDFTNPELAAGSVYISIQPKDFTLKRLVCLAQTLTRNQPEWKSTSVLMFISVDAALYFDAAWKIEGPPQSEKWASQLHAVYSFDRASHEERLNILPLGYDTAPPRAPRACENRKLIEDLLGEFVERHTESQQHGRRQRIRGRAFSNHVQTCSRSLPTIIGRPLRRTLCHAFRCFYRFW